MEKDSNWAGSIKDCLESYGFQDVWTSGRVDNEKAFLSSFKQRMIDRFKQEWNTKISESGRFSNYDSFKSVHQLETFLNTITSKMFRGTLIRLRLESIENCVNKSFKCDSFVNKNCSYCPNKLEDTISQLNLKKNRTDLLRKLAMLAFYALKHREELLAQ